MDTIAQDIRFAWRGFVKSPSFTIAAALTLALGIGANTIIFSVVSAVLIRPLPYRDSARLVLVRELIPKFIKEPISFSVLDYLDVQKSNQSFDAIAAFRTRQHDIAGSGDPERAFITQASANLFDLLGVKPVIGRTFTGEEEQKGAQVAVLTWPVWKARYAGDRSVIGKEIIIDRKPYTIIGVMPAEVTFPDQGIRLSRPPHLWIPLTFSTNELVRADSYSLGVLAHLKPGISLPQANTDLHRIAKHMEATYPADIRNDINLGAIAIPVKEEMVGDVRTLMFLLLGSVGGLLLIACANVANLLLSRAAARQKEMAIRIALGASRRRVTAQMLTESCLLALAGCVAGVAIAAWGVDLLIPSLMNSVPRMAEVRIDWMVLAFSVSLSLVTGIVFGISPALAAWRTDTQQRLKDGTKGSAGAHQSRLQQTFVVAEVAVSVVLLIGSGLLVRSFLNMQTTNPGFRPERALSFGVAASNTAYKTPADRKTFFTNVYDRVSGLPGVTSVGIGSDLPMKGKHWTRVFTPEQYKESDANPPVNAYSLVMGRYFEALGIPLRAGRFFTEADASGRERVIIVSETLARKFWPGENVVGKRVKFAPRKADAPWSTIVGVVADVPDERVDDETLPHIYAPYVGTETLNAVDSNLLVVVRTNLDPKSLMAALRAQIWALDRQAPISEMQPLSQTVTESESARRLNTWLIGVFAASALLLAAIGIYGVIAYSVTQRTQEIGIRMALGAESGSVLAMVMRQGAQLAAAGTAIGVILSLWIVRYIGSLLYQVHERDLATFAFVTVFLLGVAMLASYLPARRASRVDPMIALRYE